MLKTYKQKLIRDYEAEKDLLAQFLGAENPEFLDKSAIAAVRDFIVGMPEVIQDMNAMIRRQVSPPQLNYAFGFLVSYLLDPQDFLPEETFGFFGHLDDAYLTGCILEWALEFIDPARMEEIGVNMGRLEEYVALKKRAQGFLPPQIKENVDTVLTNMFRGTEMLIKNLDLQEMEKQFSEAQED
jgi:uncharacterized membrane protein YkvA (DUF1232 family)